MENSFHLVLWRGPIGPRLAPRPIPCEAWKTVRDCIPPEYLSADIVDVRLNGVQLTNEQIRTLKPKAGDTLSLRPVAGWAILATAIQVSIAITNQVIIWQMNAHQRKRARKTKKHFELGSYNLDVMGDTSEDGAPIPIVMGKHRVGGIIAQQFTRQYEEGRDKFYELLAVSEGPVNGISDVHFDGNDYTNYDGASVNVTKLGTNAQTAISDYRGTTTTSAYNNQMTYGSAITLTGTVASDKAIIKMTMVSGLYYQDKDGHPHGALFQWRYRYQTDGGGYGAWVENQYCRRRADLFSIWEEITFASSGIHDVQIERRSQNHDAANGKYSDAYVKEYQEIAFDDLTYPDLALVGVSAVSNDQLTGTIPRVTALVEGIKVQTLSSATAVAAATWTQNPADLMLGLLYNRRWGLGNEIDTRLTCTMTATALDYTVGEVITGPANDYKFRGVVRAWDGTTETLVVESTQGLPYGILTGATSGKTATVSTIDDAYGCDLAALYTLKAFCDTYVPNAETYTTVNGDSASGQPVLNVTSTSGFSDGDTIRINTDGARDETIVATSVHAGHFHCATNLVYTHTALQADRVDRAEKRANFDFVFNGQENGWDALERIAKTCRAMVVRYGSYISVKELKSETPGQLVTMGNITGPDGKSTLKIHYNETGVRPNRIAVLYTDEDFDYRQEIAAIEDPAAVAAGERPIPCEIELYGITRRHQALREGLFRLKKLRYTGKLYQWEMGVESIDFMVGDVVNLAHDIPGLGYASGRVVSSTASTVTLDRDVTLPAGTHTVRVRHADDTQESQTITSTAGTYRTISISPATWTANPVLHELYVVGSPQQVRVLSVKLREDQTAEISAEADSSAYYTDSMNDVPTWTESTLPDSDKIPSAVTELILKEKSAVLPDKSLQYGINVYFRKPAYAGYSHAQVYLKENSGQLYTQGRADRTSGTGNAEFSYPKGICCDGTYVYVADTNNNRIVKLNYYDLSYVADLGSAGSGNGQFSFPEDVSTDGTHIWVADTGNNRVQKLTVAGAYVAKLGTVGAGADQFAYPTGIVKSGSYVFVCDTYNHRLVKIDSALVGSGGGTWTTIGSQGSGNDQFERPNGIDTDGTSLFIADTGNNRIQKRLYSDLSYVAKIGSSGSGNDNFNYPTDIACSSDGTKIWVADMMNNRIVRRSGADALTYADEVGALGYRRNQFYSPSGICQNGANVYLSEYRNHRVQARDDEEANQSVYEYKGTTATQEATIDNVAEGEEYTVSVVSCSPRNAHLDPSAGTTATITISGRAIAPPDVTGFAAVLKGPLVCLTWNPVNCSDLKGYEIRLGTSLQLSQVLGTYTGTSTTTSAPNAGQTATYYCRAVTRSEVFSATAATTSYTKPMPSVSFPPSYGWNWGA